jgi:solute carrier family 25 carnitine/acylcarnitine transporter 20/29
LLPCLISQRWGGNVLATPARLASSFGFKIFTRGLVTASGREGLFTAGYLGLAPSLTRYLSENYNAADSVARIFGAIGAGLVSATLSHPMDTIKTCMQGDVEQTTYKTVTQTGKTLYDEGGFARMYRGWGWRTGRMILGIFILNVGKSLFAPFLFPHHFH